MPSTETIQTCGISPLQEAIHLMLAIDRRPGMSVGEQVDRLGLGYRVYLADCRRWIRMQLSPESIRRERRAIRKARTKRLNRR